MFGKAAGRAITVCDTAKRTKTRARRRAPHARIQKNGTRGGAPVFPAAAKHQFIRCWELGFLPTTLLVAHKPQAFVAASCELAYKCHLSAPFGHPALFAGCYSTTISRRSRDALKAASIQATTCMPSSAVTGGLVLSRTAERKACH